MRRCATPALSARGGSLASTTVTLYVCVPPAMHGPRPDGAPTVEILAAERGVHLFVEKPVCLELEVGSKIRDAIERGVRTRAPGDILE